MVHLVPLTSNDVVVLRDTLVFARETLKQLDRPWQMRKRIDDLLEDLPELTFDA